MDADPTRTRPEGTFDREAYWRATLRRLLWLLAVWALVGPVMSIVFVQQLNAWSIGGIPFGFWMGHQGSIYVFVALIFINAYLADRTDREFGVDETPDTTRHIVSGH